MKALRRLFGIDRLSRFNLRTALVTVTVLALWMGFHWGSVRKQRAAIEAIERHGGWADYDFVLTSGACRSGSDESFVAEWLSRLLGPDHFHDVVAVKLSSNDNLNTRLNHLGSLPKLSVLHIRNAQLTDIELEHISEHKGLRVLLIQDAQNITERGFAHLSELDQLERLTLEKCELTSGSLRVISELPNLAELWLQDTHFADGALEHIQGMGALCTLGLGSEIGDEDLVYLSQMTQLEVLAMQYSDVTDVGLRQLVGLRNLRSLWLEGSDVNDASWLKERLPACNIHPAGLVP